MEPTFIDTTLGVRDFLEQLHTGSEKEPLLYVDLEGNNLSRHGTISLLTIFVEPRKTVHLIDITTLGHEAFSTATSDGLTLKSILESSQVIKVFFDIRNDSDAMFNLFGIRVAGIQDLQLMELASRSFGKKCVNGLSKCIANDAQIEYTERRQWEAAKDSGRRLFAPECGGSYAVFDARPLSEAIVKYCVQDVLFMPGLRDVYCAKLCDAWWAKIEAETAARIQLSQSAGYNGKGRHMALGPSAWMHWNPSLQERNVRTFQVFQPANPNAAGSSTLVSETPPSSAPPTESRVLEPVRQALMHREAPQQLGASICDDDDDDDRHSAFGFGRSPYSHYGAYDHDDDNDGWRDLTACDSECGYCGQCPY